MINKYWRRTKFKLIFLLGFSSLVWINLDLRLFAKTDIDSHNQDIQDIGFVSYHKQPTPPDHGTPKKTRGTGSRGNCFYEEDSAPLKSLVGNGSLTKTLKKYPSFWIYIPFSAQEVSTAEFTIQDGENDLYRSSLKMPQGIPGIVEIKLPETVAPLKTGKSYRWYFEINCPSLTNNGDNSSTTDTLTGIVQKIEPSSKLQHKLESTATMLERIEILAKHGIWYDTFTQLAQLRLQNSQQSSSEQLWNKLLSQPNVNLNDISDKNIVGIADSI